MIELVSAMNEMLPGRLILIVALIVFALQATLIFVINWSLRTYNESVWREMGAPNYWSALEVSRLKRMGRLFKKENEIDKRTLLLHAIWKWLSRLFGILAAWLVGSNVAGYFMK